MKYIVNREVFIQRNISKKFEKTPYSGHNFPIYEEYGSSGSGQPMFSNNIGFNDSLLGRLINWGIRKIKVKLASLSSIPKLIDRLNAEFDKIYTHGCLVLTYDADIKYKIEFIKLEFYSFLFEIKNSVESEKVSVIKSLVKNAIDKLKEGEELEDKDKMISELEKFLEFLENYKDDKVDDSVNVEKLEDFSNKYDLLVSNLNYLSKIIQQYKSINLDDSSSSSKSTLPSVKPVNPNVNVVANKNNIKPIVDSYQLFCENKENFISKEQSHALQAFKKLKIQCQNLDKTLKGSKDPIVSNVELGKIISNKDSDVYKNFIIKLFVSVVKNLSGKNKTFVAPVGKLYENWNLRIDKLTTSEFGSISDKISRFAHVALLFKNDEELYSEYNFDKLDFGKNLKGYVDTISQIKSLKVDTSNSDNNDNNSNNEEISKYFEENCKIVSEFKADEKVIEELEVKLKNIKIKKGFIIDGFDPVIEILRIFNQAYKLYMTPIITKRSQNLDGSAAGPSPGTLFEYTDMGSQGTGPWRNNEIFDKWENAVYDILGNRKYQVIFDKDTVLKVGDEMREGKGAKLRQFMTDILDGSKLYKNTDGKGSQAKLLDSYFDTIPDGTDVNTNPPGGDGSTLEANVGMQGKIDDSSKKIEILKLSSRPVYTATLGTFFIIDGFEIENKAKVQIFAHYVSKDRIAFIRSFGPWEDILDPIKITKNELTDMIIKPKSNNKAYTIFYTNVNNFKNEIELNREMTIKFTDKDNYTKSETLNLKVDGIYKVCIKEGDDLKLLDLSTSFEKDYKQKFINSKVDIAFKPLPENKIVKYTK